MVRRIPIRMLRSTIAFRNQKALLRNAIAWFTIGSEAQPKTKATGATFTATFSRAMSRYGDAA
jgi:hypothetical protein